MTSYSPWDRCSSDFAALRIFIRMLLLALLVSVGQRVYAQSVSITNLGANQATLNLSGMSAGTAYITLLDGGAICGSAAQIKAGEDNKGAAAFRTGSLALSASVSGAYTVRNLMENTNFSVCVTDAAGATASASFTTNTKASYNS